MRERRMRARDRKEAIVKAAAPLFARKGFARTTTRELAEAARVSEPLLYKHFPSKEALYLEIQTFSCQGIDPAVQRMNEWEPSTETLVRLVYYLIRALVAGRPTGALEWDVRHRLTLNSILEDGTFARLLYRNRFDEFCSRIQACLEAAVRAGEAVPSPLSRGSSGRFAHHLAAWLAYAHLPRNRVINYRASREQLLREAVWFALRGMGVTDEALAKHYKPVALERFFKQA